MKKLAAKLRDWMEETHGTAFELRRHFFRRFFDSDLVSSAGQWQVVAGGFIAIVLSLCVPMIQAYYHKYLMLQALDSPQPYRMAAVADHLFLITFSMTLTGLLTAMQWPSLFPGLRDYLVLAGLPVRTRDVFVAKFMALLTYIAIFIAALNWPPCGALNFAMHGRYYISRAANPGVLFLSMTLAAFFVFFALVALQGLLLNVVSPRLFPGVSLLVQCILFTLLICFLPFVLSIPGLDRYMHLRPDFARWIPPAWFLGLDQEMLGNREPYVHGLAVMAKVAAGAAAFCALAAYLWSYRRQKVRMIETPIQTRHEFAALRRWRNKWSDRFLPQQPEHAVFSFTMATLARSRLHRMVLTGFVAVAFALIVESFVSLILGGGFKGFAVKTFALEEAAVSAPLALSLFVLAGYRYLFRLPVEVRANWLFRVHEGGNRELLLRGMERFVFCLGVLPIALLTLPLEIEIFGALTGAAVSLLAFLPSLVMEEVLLAGFEKIPFTSAYLPGKRPLIETVCMYGIAFGAYVGILSGLIVTSLRETPYFLIVLGSLLAIWARVRKGRLEYWHVGELEFEEVAEPAVQTLAIYRD
ncbi:MAG: hypothetical protein P4L56_03745 [Candidatus Sulfopaludibacter sp.]|nr:hypothetical protein [Candidatus Sulfopaludibacter sp.]